MPKTKNSVKKSHADCFLSSLARDLSFALLFSRVSLHRMGWITYQVVSRGGVDVVELALRGADFDSAVAGDALGGVALEGGAALGA